jgi:hypothetical protein
MMILRYLLFGVLCLLATTTYAERESLILDLRCKPASTAGYLHCTYSPKLVAHDVSSWSWYGRKFRCNALMTGLLSAEQFTEQLRVMGADVDLTDGASEVKHFKRLADSPQYNPASNYMGRLSVERYQVAGLSPPDEANFEEIGQSTGRPEHLFREKELILSNREEAGGKLVLRLHSATGLGPLEEWINWKLDENGYPMALKCGDYNCGKYPEKYCFNALQVGYEFLVPMKLEDESQRDDLADGMSEKESDFDDRIKPDLDPPWKPKEEQEEEADCLWDVNVKGSSKMVTEGYTIAGEASFRVMLEADPAVDCDGSLPKAYPMNMFSILKFMDDPAVTGFENNDELFVDVKVSSDRKKYLIEFNASDPKAMADMGDEVSVGFISNCGLMPMPYPGAAAAMPCSSSDAMEKLKKREAFSFTHKANIPFFQEDNYTVTFTPIEEDSEERR